MQYVVYMVRCADNSLYTGITTDITRRINQHNGVRSDGSRYTRSRRPVTLVYTQNARSKAMALRLEARIKSKSKTLKEQLISRQG